MPRQIFRRGESYEALLWLVCDIVYRLIAAELCWRGLEVEVPDKKHDEDAQLHLCQFSAGV